MRKFSSYGPIDTDLHYYAPRQALIDQAMADLVGENPAKGGHYITVWAPRQRGKTWIIQQALRRLQSDPRYAAFDVVYLALEYLKLERDAAGIAQSLARQFSQALGLPSRDIREIKELEQLFHRDVLQKPLILMLDEFDALTEEAIPASRGSSATSTSSGRRSGPGPPAKRRTCCTGSR
jgi:Cdc6-like AAA superfamily ATPase